jgi:predicted nucleic-acid-binding Zn-ribbon protein
MSIVLPRFGTVESCPKCGAPAADMVSVVYHAEAQMHVSGRTPCTDLYTRSGDDPFLEESLENHLCRTCRRCGFEWVERALDSPQTPEEAEESEDAPCLRMRNERL